MFLRKTVLATGLAILVLGAGPALARQVTIALHNVPPYVVTDAAGRVSGVEVELLAMVAERAGWELHPLPMPYARIRVAYVGDPEIDAAAPVLESYRLPGTLSKPFIRFQNVARTLSGSGIVLHSLDDLRGRHILAFQNARDSLGPRFAAIVATPGTDYAEQANQMLPLRMLGAGRVDIVIAERRILDYFGHLPETGLDPAAAFVDYPLFPPSDYSVAFHDRALAEAFDRALAASRADGSYARILRNADSHPPS